MKWIVDQKVGIFTATELRFQIAMDNLRSLTHYLTFSGKFQSGIGIHGGTRRQIAIALGAPQRAMPTARLSQSRFSFTHKN